MLGHHDPRAHPAVEIAVDPDDLGFANVMGMVRPFGWVRLKTALARAALWMLCRRRSLFRNSTVPPAGTTITRGMNTHCC